MDRAAVAPIARGETPYERSVREALARETRRRARPAPAAASRQAGRRVIASVEGVVGAIAADSLVIEVGGIGYRVFAAPAVIATATARRPAQAPHLPPRPRGPAGAVRLPDVRGARVLQPAAHGDRRRAQGRDGDRRLAADRRPAARDPAAGPGGAGVDPRASARSSPSGSSSSSRRRCPRRASRPARRPRSRRASEGEVVAALQALGYSPGEAREASRLALRTRPSAPGLEERVKAALRTLLRD